MKARLIKENNSIKLLLYVGEILTLDEEQAKRFLLTYDSEKHYNSTSLDVDAVALDNMPYYNGETLAYVTDEGELVITQPNFFRTLFADTVYDYLTASEYGELHGKKAGIIKRLCREGRIEGVIKKGSQWLIPKDAEYPQDARFGTRV